MPRRPPDGERVPIVPPSGTRHHGGMKNARGEHRSRTALRRAARSKAAIAGAAAMLAIGLAACTGGARPAPTAAAQEHVDWDLAGYSGQAIGLWNAAVERGEQGELTYDFDSVRWTGDPREYAKVCGIELTLPDGTLPVFSGAAEEQWKASHAGVSYSDWIEAEPARWGAFNAWLRDPAVLEWNWYGSNTYARIAGSKTPALDDAVGPDSGCPGAFEKVRELRTAALPSPVPTRTPDAREQAFDDQLADYYAHHDTGSR